MTMNDFSVFIALLACHCQSSCIILFVTRLSSHRCHRHHSSNYYTVSPRRLRHIIVVILWWSWQCLLQRDFNPSLSSYCHFCIFVTQLWPLRFLHFHVVTLVSSCHCRDAFISSIICPCVVVLHTSICRRRLSVAVCCMCMFKSKYFMLNEMVPSWNAETVTRKPK